VVFTAMRLIMMDVKREGCMGSTQQQLEIGDHVDTCLQYGEKKKASCFETSMAELPLC
jgi:hypothetical protein